LPPWPPPVTAGLVRLRYGFEGQGIRISSGRETSVCLALPSPSFRAYSRMAAGGAYRCMVDLHVQFVLPDQGPIGHSRSLQREARSHWQFAALLCDFSRSTRAYRFGRRGRRRKRSSSTMQRARSELYSRFASMATLLRASDVRSVCSVDVGSTERGVLAKALSRSSTASG
jgi:hypothetical protein